MHSFKAICTPPRLQSYPFVALSCVVLDAGMCKDLQAFEIRRKDGHRGGIQKVTRYPREKHGTGVYAT